MDHYIFFIILIPQIIFFVIESNGTKTKYN